MVKKRWREFHFARDLFPNFPLRTYVPVHYILHLCILRTGCIFRVHGMSYFDTSIYKKITTGMSFYSYVPYRTNGTYQNRGKKILF